MFNYPAEYAMMSNEEERSSSGDAAGISLRDKGKQYSVESVQALDRIDTLREKYKSLALLAEQIHKSTDARNNESAARAKGQLSQLLGDIEKLQCNQLDAVVTGHLSSGRAEARSSRRDLNEALDELHDFVTSLFRMMDTPPSQQQPTQSTASSCAEDLLTPHTEEMDEEDSGDTEEMEEEEEKEDAVDDSDNRYQESSETEHQDEVVMESEDESGRGVEEERAQSQRCYAHRPASFINQRPPCARRPPALRHSAPVMHDVLLQRLLLASALQAPHLLSPHRQSLEQRLLAQLYRRGACY